VELLGEAERIDDDARGRVDEGGKVAAVGPFTSLEMVSGEG
jgi:hypothetical protein